MASVLLTAAGSALGAALPGVGFLAGPLLGLAGGQLGGTIDAALGIRGTSQRGPRLDSLRLQDSREGAPRPIIYGTLRTAGNVIWASPLIERRKTKRSGGGKSGSVRTTTYSYSVHLAIGLCAGPIAGIHRVWADSKLIYDNGLNRSHADALRLYRGEATQLPDALIESYLGAGNVPAYRGSAYLVIEDLQLDAFGNRIPNITVEVEGASQGFAPEVISEAQPGYLSGIVGAMARPFIVNGRQGQEILLAAFEPVGGQYRFVVEHYDWRSDGFALSGRVTSPPFSGTGNFTAALAPDGTSVFMANISGLQAGHMAIYTPASRSYGPMTPLNLTGAVSFGPDAVWLDAETVMLKANDTVSYGLLPVARAGNSLTAPLASAYLPLFPGPGRAFLADRFAVPIGGTLLVMASDANRTTFAGARLSRQNGQFAVQHLPEITVGAPGSTPNCSIFRVYPNGGNELVAIRRTLTGELIMETMAVTASGVSITRPASVIPVSGGNYLDAILAASDTVMLIDQDDGYNLAEVTLTESGFTLARDYTPCAGSYGTTLYTPRLAQLSPYDFASMTMPAAGGKLHWIRRGSPGRAVSDIMADIGSRSGLVPGDMDMTAGAGTLVSGFAVTEPMTARRAAESLLAAYPFALAESDYTLRLTDLRTAPALTINTGATRASLDSAVPPISIERKERRELPRALVLTFYDAGNSYQQGSVRAALDADPQASADTTSLPLVLLPTDAQAIAQRLLAGAQAEQLELSLALSRDWLGLDTGDIIGWQGRSWRVSNISQRGGLLQVTANGFSTAALIAPANSLGMGGSVSYVPYYSASLLQLELPPFGDPDDAPGCYLAAGASTGWPGGTLFDASDIERASFTGAATTGRATTILPAAAPDYMDRAGSVTVTLANGNLLSCTDEALLNGANLALLGAELIQFRTATLTAPQTWQLSNLLRGRYGTEYACADHTAGEGFILLEEDTLQRLPLVLTDRGRSEDLTLVTTGGTADDTLPATITYQLRNLEPYSPAQLSARQESGGDISISWIRRARLNNGWADYIDVPLDDTLESYMLDIVSGSTVIRSITTSSANFTYSAADQLADFGAPVTSLSVAVAQVSSRYGRGRDATASFTF